MLLNLFQSLDGSYYANTLKVIHSCINTRFKGRFDLYLTFLVLNISQAATVLLEKIKYVLMYIQEVTTPHSIIYGVSNPPLKCANEAREVEVSDVELSIKNDNQIIIRSFPNVCKKSKAKSFTHLFCSAIS